MESPEVRKMESGGPKDGKPQDAKSSARSENRPADKGGQKEKSEGQKIGD